MDWSVIKERLSEGIKKYKFVMIILLAGLFLILLPSKDSQQQQSVIQEGTDNILSVEEQLSEILTMVRGAGRVEVMLTVAIGEETLYQTDESDSNSQDNRSYKAGTVTVTDSDRNETGLIKQINPPVYRGAVIICQGADNPAVRLAMVEAVMKITGLGADKISVLKMK